VTRKSIRTGKFILTRVWINGIEFKNFVPKNGVKDFVFHFFGKTCFEIYTIGFLRVNKILRKQSAAVYQYIYRVVAEQFQDILHFQGNKKWVKPSKYDIICFINRWMFQSWLACFWLCSSCSWELLPFPLGRIGKSFFLYPTVLFLSQTTKWTEIFGWEPLKEYKNVF